MTYLKNLTVAAVSVALSTTLLADDNGLTATILDVGDQTCITVAAPDHAILVTSESSPDGACGAALGNISDTFGLLVYTGLDDGSLTWPASRSLGAATIENLNEEDRYFKSGLLEIDYLPLNAFVAKAQGFAFKLTYANTRITLMSDGAYDALGDGSCAEIGFTLDDDAAFLLDTDLVQPPSGTSAHNLSQCFIEKLNPHLVVLAKGDTANSDLVLPFNNAGVSPRNILSTDRSNQGSSIDICDDPIGDDTVRVTIEEDGLLQARYIEPQGTC